MATYSVILAWENPMDRGTWQATVYKGFKELETTQQQSTQTFTFYLRII